MARLNLILRSSPRPPLLTLALLLLAAAMAGDRLLARDRLLAELEEGRRRLERAEHALRLARPDKASRPLQDSQALAEVDRIAHELTLPWAEVWDTLQQATPVGIELQKIQPDLATGQVLLQGHARDSQTFLGYLAQLRTDPHWRNVQPLSEDRDRIRTDNPVLFRLSLAWRQP